MLITLLDDADLPNTATSYQDLVEDNPKVHWAGNW